MLKTNLKLSDRKFPTRTARMICQFVYGKKLVNSTWRSWREAIGVPLRAGRVTGDQLLGLCAIAFIRKTVKRRSILREELNQAEVDVSPVLASAISELDKGKVLGADIQKLYTDFCCRPPSQSTLYRRIPNFSRKDYYPKAWVLKVA